MGCRTMELRKRNPVSIMNANFMMFMRHDFL